MLVRPGLVFGSLLLVLVSACAGDDGTDTGADEGSSGPETSGDGDGDGDPTETGETGDDTEGTLIELPGGTFEMGCGESEIPCDVDNPPHQVTVSPFSIEQTEVTTWAYTLCVDAGGCEPLEPSGTCNYGIVAAGYHPINCVTWDQAVAYCEWKGRRLPTEAEWEYAATGGNDRPYPWGTAPATCDFAHMYQVIDMVGDFGCMTGTTALVGSYPAGASAHGLVDLAGNVEEWVADWYAEDYYTTSPGTDPEGPSDGDQRVTRGGDWYDASEFNLRVFDRSHAEPATAASERGFRCAAD